MRPQTHVALHLTTLKEPGGTFSSIFHLFYIEIPKLFKIKGDRRKYTDIFDQKKKKVAVSEKMLPMQL